MAGKQYVYNQQVITVPDGQSPPAGAIPLGTGGSTSSTNSFNLSDPSGGLSSDAFAQAQASGGGVASGGITIPLFRDRNLGDGTYSAGSSGHGSANAAESAPKKSSGSANAIEHSLTSSGSPAQFAEDAAVTQFATILQSPDLFKSWAQIALNAGLISPDQMTDAVALGQAWHQAVTWAINFKAASNGTVELTPFEAAQQVAQNTGSALAAQQAYAAAHFTGDKTFTQTSTNAQDAPEQMLHDLLGRNPTKGELAAYQHGVASVAKANPTTTNTTTHYKDGQAVSQDSVVSGGYDERQAQIDAAYAATPEVAANQQATTYYNALVQALGSAV